MSNTLLPCPFCGGETDIEEIPGSPFTDETYVWGVGCKECNIGWYEGTEEEAIAAWNRRTGKDINVATNADRIRSMSDEELAEFLRNIRDCGDYEELKFIGGVRMDYVSVIEWLKQPVKEE